MRVGTAVFEMAIPVVLDHEGGFSDHPEDPGGATAYGISLRLLEQEGLDLDRDGDIDVDDIRGLTLERAREIYRERFWERYRYDELPDQAIATKVFDLCVNTGPRQAHRVLQRGIRAAGLYLADDGFVGPRTRDAIETLVMASSGDAILAATRSEAAGFYRELIARKPALEKFRKGWLRRAYS